MASLTPQISSTEQAVAQERLRLLRRNLPLSMALSSALAALVTLVMLPVASPLSCFLWLALVLLTNAARAWCSLRARAAALPPEIALRQLRLGLWLAGAAWGASAWLLDLPTSGEHQLYLTIALAGLCAAAVMGYAGETIGTLGFMLLALAPNTTQLLLGSQVMGWGTAAASLLFLLFASVNLRQSQIDLTQTIALRLRENERNQEIERMHAQIQEAARRFQSLTELSSDWYWEQDESFRFTNFEGQIATEAGITHINFFGKTRWDIGAINMTEKDWAMHQAVLQAHLTFHDLELCRIDASGEAYWSSISGRPVFDDQGRFLGYRGVGRVITERKRAEDETQRMAYYDTLTGLPNRRFLLARLPQSLAASLRSNQLGALLFIDLDNFKQINDTLGHQVGDDLLQQVAKRLASSVRESDTIARLGGDEFVVVMENLSASPTEAAALAQQRSERLLSVLNTPYTLADQEQFSSPSIGVALFGQEPNVTVDDMLVRADAAMYQAKAAGRNTVRFFDPNIQSELNDRVRLEKDLRVALQEGQLELHYQPQVLADGDIFGAEALVRWNHPQRGLIMPGEFIHIAEQSNLIQELGSWVLHTGCAKLADWDANPHTRNLKISVNVSAKQLHDADFVERVTTIIKETGARPELLTLELTESQLLNHVEQTVEKMNALKALGVGFSLDDFGTGYSSLSYLKRLPLDTLKIDQSFVRDVLSDPNDATLARSIISLAHHMGLSVIAEGVETREHLAFLAEHGCNAYQGYLFGRPMPAQALEKACEPDPEDMPQYAAQAEGRATLFATRFPHLGAPRDMM